jgi:hypothetical protein
VHHNDLMNQSLVANITREVELRREQVLTNRGARAVKVRRMVSWRDC